MGSLRVVWQAWEMTRPRRCKRTPERSWAGICPAWLRIVDRDGQMPSDLQRYPRQPLSMNGRGSPCQGLFKDWR